jgi:hypothetical protein
MKYLTTHHATGLVRLENAEETSRRLKTVIKQNPLSPGELTALNKAIAILESGIHKRPDVIFSEDEISASQI